MPGFHSSTGQKRLESGVITSSHSTSSPSTSPSSNLVSAMMIPRSRAIAAPRAVELERDVAGPGGQLGADEVARPRSKEMFSSCTSLLVDGVNTGSGSCVALLQPGGQRLAVHGAAGLVLLPGRAREVAADDALDREHLGLAAQHDPAGQVGIGLGDAGGEVGDVGGDEVAAGHVAERLEPEGRDRGEHAALVEDRLVEHDVEGGEPVGGDHQELVVADGVDVPDLAGVQVGQGERHAAERSGLEDRLGPVGGGARGGGPRPRRPGRRRPAPGPRRCRRTTAARRPRRRARRGRAAGGRRRPGGRGGRCRPLPARASRGPRRRRAP